jgi:hypothetical protein
MWHYLKINAIIIEFNQDLWLVIMLSLEIREIAEKLNHLSMEDKQWLIQQLMEQISASNIYDISKSNSLSHVKNPFNITPAASGSGYNDTSINHDQILANSIKFSL